ncbi:MAG: hypothetical protein H6591_10765 [Flavobacteriales bacterium]|nr:hypothetical protein [Flavobacteriales bacterium]
MSRRNALLLVVLLPLLAMAQGPARTAPAPFNAPTLVVLLANRPTHIEEAKWLEMMQEPVNRSLYPLRVTQAMLDTLDATLLDRRFNYELIRGMPVPGASPDAPR